VLLTRILKSMGGCKSVFYALMYKKPRQNFSYISKRGLNILKTSIELPTLDLYEFLEEYSLHEEIIVCGMGPDIFRIAFFLNVSYKG